MQTTTARVEVPEESTFVSNLSCKWNRSDDLSLIPYWPFLLFQKFTAPTVQSKPVVPGTAEVVLIRNALAELQDGRKNSQHLRTLCLGTRIIANLSVSAALKYTKSNLV